jgi:hypothetical protein
MTYLKYIILAISSLLITISAYILAPVLAWFVDADGNLPKYLRWYQTIDAPCYGAEYWTTDNPT